MDILSTMVERKSQIRHRDTSTTVRDVRRPYEKQLAAHLILASIVLEATAFYALDYNVTSSLNSNATLNWTSDHSKNASDIFDGFPLCLISLILYTLITSGRTFLCPGHQPTDKEAISIGDEKCAPLVLGTLILFAIGDGAVRSNLIVFGADQLPETIKTFRYFDKFVVVINLASILETATELIIPVDRSYLIFFVSATSMLFVAIILFLSGWRYYRHIKAYDTVLTNCISVYKNAFETWRQHKKSKRRTEERDLTVSAVKPVRISYGLINEEVEESVAADGQPSKFLDFAKLVNHGEYPDRIVNDVKALQSALIMFILILPYRLVFVQLYKTFPAQAAYMTVPDSTRRADVINLLLISEHTILIIGIFILNVFFYKYLHARNRSLAIGAKFVISMCFAIITMGIAGSTELIRQHHCPDNWNQTDSAANVSNLSIYAQLPEHIGIGLAQVFGLLASFEFAYFIAPRSAQSLFMSLHFVSRIIAEYIVAGYMTQLSTTSYKLDFSCQNNAPWRTYAYFFIFGAVQVIFTVVFILCQKYYRMIKLKGQQMEQNRFHELSATCSTDRH